MTSTTTPIADALRLFVAPEQVTELRALKVVRRYGAPRNYSGYFDDAHLDGMAKAAAEITAHAKGTYFVPNPIKPDVLARRCNRVDVAGEDETTKDHEILRRLWFYIDVDPKRPTGISATDAEKSHALDAIQNVREWLASNGWPAPVFADSGNGYHLFYRVDLPTDDGGLLQRCLVALAARFDSDLVDIDRKVFNPARIMKLPGTWARKGDDMPDRPHRMGSLIDVPRELQIVPVELLERLAVDAPKAERKSTTSHYNGDGRLDVARWLSDRGVTFRTKNQPDSKGRTVYVLAECPFDSSHADPDACVMQSPDGQLSAQCFHNSCSGRGWQEFKERIGKPESRHYESNGRHHEGNGKSGVVHLPHPNAEPTSLPLTDDGNGQRLVQQHGKNLLHCHPWKKWLCWDETRWKLDDEGRVMALTKDTIRGLFRWAKTKVDELQRLAESGDERAAAALAKIQDVLKWALKSQDVARIKAALDLARSEPGVPVLPSKLDSDAFLLNVQNGTVDLRTGKLRPHAQADYLTKLANVEYFPDAVCPAWDAFLDRIMQSRKALIAYLQRVTGYSLTANVSEQVLLFLHGEGANGKSTYLETLKYVMGEYASTAAPDLLLVRQGDAHPTQLADLHGRRFVSTVEVDDGRRLAESLVKQLTGGDGVKARRMREDFWEIVPTWKIWMAANHRPEIRGNDFAIWRRIRLIPFTVKIPPEEQDKGLLDKLKAEAEGILAWAVRGCLEWQRIGLADPQEVLAATEEYRNESDIIGAFLAEVCNTGSPDFRVKKPDLYASFTKWTEAQGEKRAMTRNRLCIELKRRGISEDDGRRWYIGVSIRDTSNEGHEW